MGRNLFLQVLERQTRNYYLSDMVPSTKPFLKELLAGFLNAAGRDRKKAKRVDFDELGTNEVVTTLRDVPMDTVLCAASMKF